MKRLLSFSDWLTIVSNFTTIQTFINQSVSDMTSVNGSVTALEGNNFSALADRVSSLETSRTSHNSRLGALETWRSNKSAASANVATNFSVATDIITLGLAAPRASSINSIINTIMGEINGIKQVLRDREIMAT